MIGPSNSKTHREQLAILPDLRGARLITVTAALAGALAIAVLAAGCGATNSRGSAGPRNRITTTSAFTRVLAYARCMRGHGIADFPDPTSTANGGHVTIDIQAASGGDLDPANPTFKTAGQACRSLLPSGGLQSTTIPSRQLTEELKWASCLRAHGVPNFPDPNSQGALRLRPRSSTTSPSSTPEVAARRSRCRRVQARPARVGPRDSRRGS